MIRVSNVSKTYKVWRSPATRLWLPLAHRFVRPLFPNWYARYRAAACQDVQALSGISFDVGQGESLGIVGLNGSGKSTLLQIIAGTLQPSSGEVQLSGRVAALLELGSGFNPEFSGRDNVYLNGAILGMTREEVDARYQDIVAFADIGEFIDRPVKTYSSGMMLRLAFAVQVHVEPDVLIVDEALAVGDARFQAKALAKIDEILARGTTLLFVGHDLNAVRSFCKSAMLLDKGRIITAGDPETVVTEYIYFVQQDRVNGAGIAIDLQRHEQGFHAAEFSIQSATYSDGSNHLATRFGQNVAMSISLSMQQNIEAPTLIMDIVDGKGLQVTGRRIALKKQQGLQNLRITFNAIFAHGIYRIRFRIANAPSITATSVMAKYDSLLSFDMIEDKREEFTGLFPIPMEIEWQ